MKQIIYILAVTILTAACVQVPIREDAFVIDASRSTELTIPNVVSNINVWDMGTSFYDPVVKTEYNIFDFVEYVQLMTATGGSASRDLFKDPYDRNVLDDYDFDRLIENCRGILSLGAKPHIKLGNVPMKLSTNPTPDNFGVNVYPPDDYNQYYTYIRAIIDALVAEFGLEEVQSWHFGVFTEYENTEWFHTSDHSPEASAEAFCKIYDYTVQAVTDVLGEDVYIGAHSMTVTEGLWDEAELIKHCAQGTNYANGKTGTHVSYFSASFYDYNPGTFTIGYPVAQCIGYLKDNAEKYGLEGLAYGIDEGRILAGTPGSKKADIYSRTTGATYMAAYDARAYRQIIQSGASYFSSWEYLSENNLEGNPSISYHVAKCIHLMAGSKYLQIDDQTRINNDVEISTFAGLDGQTVRLAVYNFKNEVAYADTADVQIVVKPVTRKLRHNVTIYQIDDSCNWYDEWMADRKEFGITDDMFDWSPDDGCKILWNLKNEEARAKYKELMPKYAECSKLVPRTMKVRSNRDGSIVLNCPLAGNAVWFIDVD